MGAVVTLPTGKAVELELEDAVGQDSHVIPLDGDSTGEQVDEALDDDLPDERGKDVGEATDIAPVKQVGIQVLATIFIGGTSKRRFDAKLEETFRAAVASVTSSPMDNVKVSGIQDVGAPKAKPVNALKTTSEKRGVKKAAPAKKASRRLLQNVRTVDEGLQAKVVVTKLLNGDQARGVADSLDQACQGEKSSKMMTAFNAERKKRPTVDQQGRFTFRMVGKPTIVGVTSDKGGSRKLAKPKWCKNYFAEPEHQVRGRRSRSEGTEPDQWQRTWTKKDCRPDMQTYNSSLQNIDGVLCACDGVKTILRDRWTDNPDYQIASVVRAQATETKYKVYSFQLRSPRSKSRPSSDGLQYHVEFEHETGDKTDGKHKVSRRHINMEFNRIVEYSNFEGAGLGDSTTRRIDPDTKKEMQGIDCDKGKPYSSKHPGKNCVLQDFYIDRFKKQTYVDSGSSKLLTVVSDLQGTSPWCNKPACAKTPTLKPTVVFDIGFGQHELDSKHATVKEDKVDFTHAKVNVTISNFPYKFKNSTLAIRAKFFTLTMTTSISKDDETAKASQLDKMDCNLEPLPSGCPMFKVDHNAKMSWNKFIADGTNSSKKYKIIVTKPKAGKPPTSHKDRLGHALPVQNTYFSFQHGGALVLKWDPKVSMNKLPQTAVAGASSLKPWFMVSALSMIVAIVLR